MESDFYPNCLNRMSNDACDSLSAYIHSLGFNPEEIKNSKLDMYSSKLRNLQRMKKEIDEIHKKVNVIIIINNSDTMDNEVLNIESQGDCDKYSIYLNNNLSNPMVQLDIDLNFYNGSNEYIYTNNIYMEFFVDARSSITECVNPFGKIVKDTVNMSYSYIINRFSILEGEDIKVHDLRSAHDLIQNIP